MKILSVIQFVAVGSIAYLGTGLVARAVSRPGESSSAAVAAARSSAAGSPARARLPAPVQEGKPRPTAAPPQPGRIQVPELSELDVQVAETATSTNPALNLKTAMYMWLTDQMPNVLSCLGRDQGNATMVKIRFHVRADPSARRATVLEAKRLTVDKGAPLGDKEVACMLARLRQNLPATIAHRANGSMPDFDGEADVLSRVRSSKECAL
jgi:hypothetical protein